MSMLILFFDRHRIVHRKFFRPTPEARGFNGKCYLDILKWLRAHIAHIRPELFAANSWVLHHDNTPPHTLQVVADWLAKNGTTDMLHSPNSPDMAHVTFGHSQKSKKR